jgi:hypothetical protein
MKNKLYDKDIDAMVNHSDCMLRVSASKPLKSNVKAVLKIPVDAKSDKEIKHILNAIEELKEAGLKFDYGMGRGYFDLFLDHTMEGMVLIKYEK